MNEWFHSWIYVNVFFLFFFFLKGQKNLTHCVPSEVLYVMLFIEKK